MNQRGISLLEVVLATILTGTLGLLATRFLITSNRNLETASNRLVESQTSDLGLRALAEALASSHIMKSGMLQCGTSGITRDRASQPPFTLEKAGDHFEFVYSKHASVVGVRSITTREISVMDAAKFTKGDIVLLTHVNDATFGGFFTIRTVDVAAGIITLATASGNGPTEFGCNALGGVNHDLDQLATDEKHKIFNESPTTFRADVLRYAQVRFDPDPVTPAKLNLTMSTWPSAQEDATSQQVRPLLFQVDRFVLTTTWTKSDEDGGGVVGYDYEATRKFERMVAGADSGKEVVSGRVSYSLGGSLRRNFSAPTTASPPQVLFPSCAITVTSVSGGFIRESDPKAVLELVRVDGIHSSLGGQFGTIEIVGGGDDLPRCWTSSQADQFGFATVATSPNTLDGPTTLKGGGISVGFTLVPNVAGGLDPAYCDLPPNSSLGGKLVYYDESVGKLVNVSCSGYLTPPQPTNFKYAASTTSTCSKASGLIQLGRLVDISDAMKDGPSLFVDDSSCQFETAGVAGAFEKCSLESATNQLNVDKKLAKVRVRPSNLTIQGVTPAEGCDCAHEITCN